MSKRAPKRIEETRTLRYAVGRINREGWQLVALWSNGEWSATALMRYPSRGGRPRQPVEEVAPYED